MQVDALVDELKESTGFCIMSNNALEKILLDSKEQRGETHELNKNIAKSIAQVANSVERLNTFFESSITQQNTANAELYQRLDTLIEKVSMNNSLTSFSTEEIDIELELKKRKETVEKIIRNEELSNYYETLVKEAQPFVRREFRTHVNKTTTERELVHRRLQAIDKVKTEINVMRDRAEEYKEKKAMIDKKIEDHLTTHEDDRAEIETRKTSQDRTLKETFERNTLTKMKETDNDEKMNSYEYLLKFTDNSSLNFRGNGSRTCNRRPSRNRRGRQRGY